MKTKKKGFNHYNQFNLLKKNAGNCERHRNIKSSVLAWYLAAMCINGNDLEI